MFPRLHFVNDGDLIANIVCFPRLSMYSNMFLTKNMGFPTKAVRT